MWYPIDTRGNIVMREMDHSSSHEALSGYLGQGGGENWLALFKSPALPTEREGEQEAERKGLGERG